MGICISKYLKRIPKKKPQKSMKLPPEEKPCPDEVGAKQAEFMAHAQSVGTFLIASVLIGFCIGVALDKIFGTLPLFKIIFFFLAMVAALYRIYRKYS